MAWIIITLTIAGIAVLAVTGIIVMRTRQKIQGLDIKKNATFIENPCRREFTEGYYKGYLKKILPRKNGCSLIEFVPSDVDQEEKKDIPKVQAIVVKNECIKFFARGELSSRREIMKLTGRSAADMPEKMRVTDEGEWMTMESQKAWILSTFKNAIQNGDEAIAEGMLEYARGNIPKNVLAEMKEHAKAYRKTQKMPEGINESRPEDRRIP